MLAFDFSKADTEKMLRSGRPYRRFNFCKKSVGTTLIIANGVKSLPSAIWFRSLSVGVRGESSTSFN
jgi:hypothetical protein